MAVDMTCQRYSIEPFDLINSSFDRLLVNVDFALIANKEENRMQKEAEDKAKLELENKTPIGDPNARRN